VGRVRVPHGAYLKWLHMGVFWVFPLGPDPLLVPTWYQERLLLYPKTARHGQSCKAQAKRKYTKFCRNQKRAARLSKAEAK
jgi:hypothetical protein